MEFNRIKIKKEKVDFGWLLLPILYFGGHFVYALIFNY